MVCTVWWGHDGPDEDAAVGSDHVAPPRKLEALGQAAAARLAVDFEVVEDVVHPKRADHEVHEQPHDLAREVDVVLAHGLWAHMATHMGRHTQVTAGKGGISETQRHTGTRARHTHAHTHNTHIREGAKQPTRAHSSRTTSPARRSSRFASSGEHSLSKALSWRPIGGCSMTRKRFCPP